MADDRGVGKCTQNHAGSYGYPTRPEEEYAFCPQCGNAMVWRCPNCEGELPEDNSELLAARFCRLCGVPYFEDEPPSTEQSRGDD